MEILGLIAEGLLFLLDALVVGGDVHAWFKGRENRVERREAKRAGLPPPPRDEWNRRVLWLTLAAVGLTAGLVAWRMAR